MAFLEAEDGKRVYYEHHAGAGRPVVLVHGWSANAHCWDTVLPALLGAGHAVVLVEHRACGRSAKDVTDTSIAHRLGDRLGGLVLTGGATPRYTQADGWPYGGTPADVEGVLAGLVADRAATFRAVANAVCVKEVSADIVESVWLAFMETGPKADATLRDLASVDQRDILPMIGAPVLMLHGSDDGFVSFDGAKAAKDVFPNARLVEFGGCGHAPFWEDGDTYRSELLAFLAGL